MRKKFLAVLIAVFMILLTGCGSKQSQYDKAVQAFESGDYTKAQKMFDKLGTFEDSSDYVEKHLYSLIKEEINKTNDLETNYFVKFYDMNKIDRPKEKAEKILEASDKDNYISCLKNLKDTNTKFNKFIEEETSKLYNKQTSNDVKPFAIDITKLSKNWSFEPAVKQSSNYPIIICAHEAYTTDTPDGANLFINNSSAEYTYNVDQIDTISVDVKDEEGNMIKALVNTEIIFTCMPDYKMYDNSLNSRPMYFVEKEGQIVLLVPSYEGEDFYIPYKLSN